ncbi:hypothetical protein D9M68_868610 [compost metagenome]
MERDEEVTECVKGLEKKRIHFGIRAVDSLRQLKVEAHEHLRSQDELISLDPRCNALRRPLRHHQLVVKDTFHFLNQWVGTVTAERNFLGHFNRSEQARFDTPNSGTGRQLEVEMRGRETLH